MHQQSSAKIQGMPTKGARGYEARDASAIGIFAVVLFLVICGFTIHLILVGVINALKEQKGPSDAWQPVHPVASGEGYRRAQLPGGTNGEQAAAAGQPQYPVLQLSPPADLKEFRAQEEQELNSYGWLNRTAGIVRLPVERAMEIVVQQGLPQRTNNTQQSAGPSVLELQQQRASQSSVMNQP